MSAVIGIRDVILRDGTTLRLRAPELADLDAIAAFFDGLDEQSRYMRFHGHGSSTVIARYYAEADGDARVALLAHHLGEVVAVAGYDRLREPGAAEVAFANTSEYQGRGAGTRMLEQLAAIAAEAGIHRFDAEVLSDNRKMIGVFRSAGFEMRRQGFGGEVRLSLDLRPTPLLVESIARRDHLSTVASLRRLVSPASIAVVGASDAPGSVGGAILRNLIEGGFDGPLHPVNRNRATVGGLRAVGHVADLSQPPELAILAIPAGAVLDVAEEAAAAGVGALVVVTAGFSDAGPEGLALEQRLLGAVRSHGLRMLGPNSLGLLNSTGGRRIDATISPLRPPAGQVAISSESAALGIALLGHASARNLGVGAFVALGSRADVSTNDLLELWEDDDEIALLLLYMESFGNPARFSQISRRVSRSKPILAVKGRRPRPEWVDSGTHTAAAFRADAAIEALFLQAGVMPVADTRELFDAAALLASQPLPLGRRIAVLTNSGGLGTVAADACRTRGLRIADLGKRTTARLAAALPKADRITNPIDVGIAAGAEDYAAALDVLTASGDVDAVVALYVDLTGRDLDPDAVLRAVGAASRRGGKPIAASILGSDGREPAGLAEPGTGLPNFRFPEACAGVLGLAADRAEWLTKPLGQAPAIGDTDPDAARAIVTSHLDANGPGWLDAESVERLLATHRIRAVDTHRCANPDQAVEAAALIGGPVALKADRVPPAHASDIDAVLLGIEGEEAIRTGWQELERRVGACHEWLGATVQPLVGPGADVLVGSVVDRDLGSLLALGLGGRQAALLGDTAYRLLPLSDLDIEGLIAASTGVATVLRGFRGAPALDAAALAALIGRFAALLADLPELRECDLNPVRVMPVGAIVLDSRMRLAPRPAFGQLKTW